MFTGANLNPIMVTAPGDTHTQKSPGGIIAELGLPTAIGILAGQSIINLNIGRF